MLCVVGLASALAAPILPLFTLPIFLVGFPRPSRFWPQTPGILVIKLTFLVCEMRLPGDVQTILLAFTKLVIPKYRFKQKS